MKKFSKINEFIDTDSGHVSINIEGEGDIKNLVVSKIKKSIQLVGGNIKLFVNGKESDIWTSVDQE